VPSESTAEDTNRNSKRTLNENAQNLAEELSKLSKQQAEAIQDATYITMSREDSAAYEERRKRIVEICTLLGKYHPL
jgi:hypothetical protein